MSTTRNWREVELEDGEVWNREKPLEGTFIKAEHEVGPNKSSMYTIRTDSGDVKVWGSTVLDDKLANVPKGSYVKLEYEGKLKSKKGSEYHSYKVFIDADTEPDEESISLDDLPTGF